VSERVQNRSAGNGPGSKSERRLAAQLAAKKAAEARKRRQALLGALAGLAVVAVLVGVFVIVNRGGNGAADQATGTPSAGASASAPAGEAAAPGAPQLPAGADPALGSKPTVDPGKGQLTKLVVTPLIKGKGPAVQAGQQITTNYVGVFYADGKEFDSSWSSGQPATFAIGVGQVIKGWDQGLVGVTVGSRVQLDLPADLAYGENPGGGRPGGPLRFVVDVLGVQ
jgi:peptidylprolyl isomerase